MESRGWTPRSECPGDTRGRDGAASGQTQDGLRVPRPRDARPVRKWHEVGAPGLLSRPPGGAPSPLGNPDQQVRPAVPGGWQITHPGLPSAPRPACGPHREGLLQGIPGRTAPARPGPVSSAPLPRPSPAGRWASPREELDLSPWPPGQRPSVGGDLSSHRLLTAIYLLYQPEGRPFRPGPCALSQAAAQLDDRKPRLPESRKVSRSLHKNGGTSNLHPEPPQLLWWGPAVLRGSKIGQGEEPRALSWRTQRWILAPRGPRGASNRSEGGELLVPCAGHRARRRWPPLRAAVLTGRWRGLES
uniref:translation initiation factor IF-2-like isoform X2 n=1 Tax=Ictidomys tridecemlineatus TaxID=43179 RepID=UPI001A9FFF18|nr:translation initiation factor IF-2-like isoform X2 [Ictidomys tridecemlineatus]